MVRGSLVMVVATGGLAINLISAWILHGRHEIDLNLRGACCTCSAMRSVPWSNRRRRHDVAIWLVRSRRVVQRPDRTFDRLELVAANPRID